MVAILIVATLTDWALAALLVSVSGFILEGVNNTGPEMPATVLLVGFVVLALAAPVAAWVMRHRGSPAGLFLSFACAPIVIAGATLLLEPLFAPP